MSRFGEEKRLLGYWASLMSSISAREVSQTTFLPALIFHLIIISKELIQEDIDTRNHDDELHALGAIISVPSGLNYCID